MAVRFLTLDVPDAIRRLNEASERVWARLDYKLNTGVHMTDRASRLARARGYLSYPGRSYVWQSGDVTDFDLGMTEGRTAVLAVGSNRAPSVSIKSTSANTKCRFRSSMRASKISISSMQRI